MAERASELTSLMTISTGLVASSTGISVYFCGRLVERLEGTMVSTREGGFERRRAGGSTRKKRVFGFF
jgi:hypothetical protein